MTQKSMGYVELEWICPNCQTRNPGSQEKCSGCGAPQPADVEFVQPLQEAIITDKDKIADAKAGPDIHCGYCGARNDADAKLCRQCGADLQEGKARSAGQVLGAHRSAPVPDVTCPACGSANPATARRCQRCGAGLASPDELRAKAKQPVAVPAAGGGSKAFIYIAVGVVAALLIFIFLSMRTQDTVGVVEAVDWERHRGRQALVPVQRRPGWTRSRQAWRWASAASAWKAHRTNLRPARVKSAAHRTPSIRAVASAKWCRIADTRSSNSWCSTVMEWSGIDSVSVDGVGFAAVWPELRLAENQRRTAQRSLHRHFSVDGEDRIDVRNAQRSRPVHRGQPVDPVDQHI
ncbi:MAG: zinc ribbon domain-containing protein [Caldilineaceae bacterium]